MATTKITSNVMALSAAQNNINSGGRFNVSVPTFVISLSTPNVNFPARSAQNITQRIDTDASDDLQIGTTVAGKYIQFGRFSNRIVDNGFVGSSMTIVSDRPSTIPLSIQGAVSQNTNLFRITNSGGSNLVNVTSAGNVGIGTSTPNTLLDINGSLNASGNITGAGTVNTLVNQTNDSPETILTRQYLDDIAILNTSYQYITGDNTYSPGVTEHFNDFTMIPVGGASVQSFTVSASGGVFSHSFNDGGSADIMVNLPFGRDLYDQYGVAQLQSNSTISSFIFAGPFHSIHQNVGRYYTKNASWRVMIARNDIHTILRFGIQPPMGGSGAGTAVMNSPGLIMDTSISPNFFFANCNGRTYSLSTDTGIPALTGMWANIYLDYNITGANTLSSVNVVVNYTLSGLRYEYLYIDITNTGIGTVGNICKRNAGGIVLGTQDPSGGNPARKAILIDWWYQKTAPLFGWTNSSDWNSSRFKK